MWALILGSVSNSAEEQGSEMMDEGSRRELTVVDAGRMDKDRRILLAASRERGDEGVVCLDERMRGVVVGGNG